MLSKKRLPLILFSASVLVYVFLFWTWSFFGYPTHGEICDVTSGTKNCESYNILLSTAWNLGKAIDHWSALITATFTVVLGVSTIGLWKATKQLWIATREMAEKQEKDTQILQRAYIGVEPGGIIPFSDGTDRAVAYIVMRNVGHLPASHLGWFINREISDDPKRQSFEMEPCIGSVLLTPETQAIKGSKYLDKNEILKRRSTPQDRKEHWLYVWGRVEYNDGFKGRRFIEFCHRYNMGAADASGRIDPITARYHEYGSKTDDR